MTTLHAVNDDDPAEHCPTCFWNDHGKCRLLPPTPHGGVPHVGTLDWCSQHATLDGNTDNVVRTFE